MSATPPKKPLRGLGRGLDALLPLRAPAASRPEAAAYGEGNLFLCPIERLAPQAGQPRRHIDAERLEELAESLRQHGLIEPLVVRRRPGTELLEIIAGERRWRAAQRAGIKQVAVVVRDVSAEGAFELALIENVQREDLDPIEFAEALDRLVREHGYTQEALAARVGKDRSTIANALRLLRLPPPIRELLVNAELSEGHARALLGAPSDAEMVSLSGKVIKGHLSVRQTEQLVRAAKQQGGGRLGSPKSPKPKSASVRDLEQRLVRRLGTRCEVRDHEGAGEILIRYSSLDELDRLLDLLL